MPQRYWLLLVVVVASGFGLTGVGHAQDSPLMRMLKSGRLPVERQVPLIENICRRGSAKELGYLLEQAVAEDGFDPSIRQQVLEAISAAVQVRKLVPTGELTRLTDLIAESEQVEPGTLRAAIELAGRLQIPELADSLESLALSSETEGNLRRSAIEQLAPLANASQQQALKELAATAQPSWRDLTAAALIDAEVPGAAGVAGDVIANAKQIEHLDDTLSSMLAKQTGAGELTSVLRQQELTPDSAKLALRFVYSIGQNDPDLVSVLSDAAGIDLNVEPLDPAAMKELVAKVRDVGDPVRGEEIFRRPELSCFNCHALSGAGGNVGPDLSAIGESSPTDYLINAIMVPDQDVKEAYATKTVLTIDGFVLTGIVVDENDQRLILREATGKTHTIPVDDIEDEVEGGSLMPKGLRGFLTDAEFVDLIAFLGQLGQAGPYAVRNEPTIQKWQLLTDSEGPVAESRTPAQLSEVSESAWVSKYAKVNSELPVGEFIAADATGPRYVRASVDVVEGGVVAWRIAAPAAASLIIDGSLETQGESLLSGEQRFEPGLHWFIVELPADAAMGNVLRGRFSKPDGSTAEFTVVGGQ